MNPYNVYYDYTQIHPPPPGPPLPPDKAPPSPPPAPPPTLSSTGGLFSQPDSLYHSKLVDSPNWYFSDKDFTQTPYVVGRCADKRSKDTLHSAILVEREIRIRAAKLIETVSRKIYNPSAKHSWDLAVPMTKVIAPAKILMHRFYMRQSCDVYKYWLVAPAVVLIASKVFEALFKISTIARVMRQVCRDMFVDCPDQDWETILPLFENFILVSLEFAVQPVIPHNFIVEFGRQKIVNDPAVVFYAFNLCTSALNITDCLERYPHDIAVTALWMALKVLNRTQPCDEAGTPWYETKGVSRETLAKVGWNISRSCDLVRGSFDAKKVIARLEERKRLAAKIADASTSASATASASAIEFGEVDVEVEVTTARRGSVNESSDAGMDISPQSPSSPRHIIDIP